MHSLQTHTLAPSTFTRIPLHVPPLPPIYKLTFFLHQSRREDLLETWDTWMAEGKVQSECVRVLENLHEPPIVVRKKELPHSVQVT